MTHSGSIRRIAANGTQSNLGLARTVKVWATPRANESNQHNSQDNHLALSAQVKLWATPTVNGNHNRNGLSANSGDGLSTMAKRWMTPQARDGHGKSGAKRHSVQLPDQVTGQLNPSWVEQLMGLPEGWTDIGGPLRPVKRNTNGKRRAPRKQKSPIE